MKQQFLSYLSSIKRTVHGNHWYIQFPIVQNFPTLHSVVDQIAITFLKQRNNTHRGTASTHAQAGNYFPT